MTKATKYKLTNKYRRRISYVLSSLLSHFSGPLINVVLSIVVIRSRTAAFWGAYVQHLLIVSLTLTIINWGSKEFLLKKFSEKPAEISRWWSDSVSGKIGVAVLLLPLILLIPLPGQNIYLIALWIWARMLFQFFEALNIYRRLFLQMAVIELVLVGLLIWGVLFFKLDLDRFIIFIIAADGVKAVLFYLMNFRYSAFRFSAQRALRFLKTGLPFLILALAGLLASRSELYLLSYFSDQSTLARYQVLSNFIQYAHLFAAAALMPFIKNLYRLKITAYDRLERRFILSGLFLSIGLTVFIFAITVFLYQFEFSYPTFILVYFNIWGFYFYFLRIQANFRDNKLRQTIALISIMGLANVVFGFIFIPAYGLMAALGANLFAIVIGTIGFRATST